MSHSRPHLRARPGAGMGRVIWFMVLIVGVVILRNVTNTSPATQDPAQGVARAGGPSSNRYVPTGDEGLGAAIAIMVDNSGSMKDEAKGDNRAKFRVARQALEEMLATTDSFIARQPGFPVKVGLYYFSGSVKELAPIAPYDAARLRSALDAMPAPDGGTAIGDAMGVAAADLYRAGIIRKYILVVTDGENTDGRAPREMATEIAQRSDGAVRVYFVAFDIDAKKFAFLREVRGEVLGANNAAALRASLDTIYRGRILAEAVDAGETLPSPTARRDSAANPINRP